MGIFDKFKKEEKQPAAKVKKAAPKDSAVLPVAKEAKEIKSKTKKAPKEKIKITRIAKKEFSQAHKILNRPLVTEKAYNLSTLENQYIFEVSQVATKNEIKKAVQDLYGVLVERVNIINVSGKKRRVGRFEGYRSGYKKAIVFLPEGQKIELISR